MPNFENYKKICIEAAKDDSIFSNFKRYKFYTDILEHTNEEKGHLYLDFLLNNNKNLVSKDKLVLFSNKDKIGNPLFLMKVEDLDVSPSTLRYIKVLYDIDLFFNFKIKPKIVEIGCGYGGQAKILYDYYNLEHYDCVDLEETHGIIKKYLPEYNLSLWNMQNLPNKEWDICISNYAFSECSIDIQEEYFDKIIKKSKFGYFTMNYISHIFNVTSYTKEEFLNKLTENGFTYQVLKEFPKTFNNNCIIIFKKNE